MNLFLKPLFAAMIVCGAMPHFTSAQELPRDVVAGLPSDTCAWIRIHNLSDSRQAFSKSRLQSILDQKAFQSFAVSWNAYTESDPFALEFGLTLKEFERIAKRDFVVAWFPANGNRLANAAIIDTTDTTKEVAATIKAAAARFAKLGLTQRSSQHKQSTGAVELLQFQNDEHHTSIAVGSRRLVIAHDAQLALRLCGAPTESIGTNTGHQQILDAFDSAQATAATGSARIDFYCSPWQVLANSEPRPANLDLTISQGFDAISALGGTAFFDDNNVAQYHVVTTLSKPLQDAAIALQPTTVSTALPQWLTQASRGIQVVGLNPQAVLKGYGHWFDATEGEGEVGIFDLVLEEIRDEPDAPGVDIKVELFDQVDSPLYLVRPAVDNGDLPVVAVVKAKQTPVVKQAVSRLLEGDPDVKKIKIRGVDAWQFGDLSRGGTRQVLGPDLSQVTICLYRDHVLVSSAARSIDSFLTAVKQDQPNQTHLSLMKFVAEHGKEDKLVGYRFAQGADWMSPSYDRLRAGTFGDEDQTSVNLGNIAVSLLSQLVSAPLQKTFTKLPPRKIAQTFLGEALDVMHTSNQDGWKASGVIRSAQPSRP